MKPNISQKEFYVGSLYSYLPSAFLWVSQHEYKPHKTPLKTGLPSVTSMVVGPAGWITGALYITLRANQGPGSETSLCPSAGRVSSWTLSCFPFLGRRTFKYISYPSCLLFKELCVLGALLAPCWVKGGGVLIHKVGIFGTTRAPEILDLRERQ